MRRDSGFTLLETLAAFLIAALALGALTQGAAGGLRAARVAGHTQEALSRARSRLAAAALAPVPGEQQGNDGGGYAWRVTTTLLLTAPPGRGDILRPGMALYAVRASVSWAMDGGTREVALDTQRVVPAQAQAP